MGKRFPWLWLLLAAIGLGSLWWWRASLVDTVHDTGGATSAAPLAASPVPQAAPVPQPHEAAPLLSDEDARFLATLQETEVRRGFYDVAVDRRILRQLASGRSAETIGDLEARAASGDASANVALAMLRECEPLIEAAQSLAAAADRANAAAKVAEAWPAERRRHLELVGDKGRHTLEQAATECRNTRLNTAAIMERLRAASEAGDENSLYALGRLMPHENRLKRFAAAAMLGHPHAQYELGMAYRGGYMKAERYGPKSKAWLELAAPRVPLASMFLAECYFAGCAGQPPDAQTGLQLLREAALMGEHRETLRSMRPLGAAVIEESPAEEKFALADFEDRLNEQGCYGAAYVYIALRQLETREQLGRTLSNFMQEQVRSLADRYWNENGAGARSLLGCD